MKPLLTLILLAFVSISFAQDHTHEQKPSTVRQEWPEFEEGELIKTKVVDWTKTLSGTNLICLHPSSFEPVTPSVK